VTGWGWAPQLGGMECGWYGSACGCSAHRTKCPCVLHAVRGT